MQGATSEKAGKDLAERQRQRRRRELEDLKHTLSDVRSRRFLWKILSGCGIFTGGFIHNGSEQYFNAGRRDVGLRLLNEIMSEFPDSYQLMQQEAMALAHLEREAAQANQSE